VRGVTKLVAAAVLFAMLAVSAFAGRSYRWCVPAAAVATASCCGPDAWSDPGRVSGADAVRSSCCEDRVFGRLPATDPRVTAPVLSLPRLLPAGVAAVVAQPPASAPALGRGGSSATPAARAGPAVVDRWKILQVIRC
jgi:hypothetical protein